MTYKEALAEQRARGETAAWRAGYLAAKGAPCALPRARFELHHDFARGNRVRWEEQQPPAPVQDVPAPVHAYRSPTLSPYGEMKDLQSRIALDLYRRFGPKYSPEYDGPQPIDAPFFVAARQIVEQFGLDVHECKRIKRDAEAALSAERAKSARYEAAMKRSLDEYAFSVGRKAQALGTIVRYIRAALKGGE